MFLTKKKADHKSNVFVGHVVGYVYCNTKTFTLLFHSTLLFYSNTFSKDCKLTFKDQVNYYYYFFIIYICMAMIGGGNTGLPT